MKKLSRLLDWFIFALGLFMTVMGLASTESYRSDGVWLGVGLGVPLLLVFAWRILRRKLYPARKTGIGDWLLYAAFLFFLMLVLAEPADPKALWIGLGFGVPMLLLYLWRQLPGRQKKAPAEAPDAEGAVSLCPNCGAPSREKLCPYCGMPKS